MENLYKQNLQQYLEDIDSIPELIPDIGSIINEYSGNECVLYTDNAKKCWSYGLNEQKFNCDQYCVDNIDNWLYPFFKQIQLNRQNIDNYSVTVSDGNRDNNILYVHHIDLESFSATTYDTTLTFDFKDGMYVSEININTEIAIIKINPSIRGKVKEAIEEILTLVPWNGKQNFPCLILNIKDFLHTQSN